MLAARLLDVIENDILPLTQAGVSTGNKVFGAAILRKSDLSLVIAGTNNETANPLWHGEVHTLKQFYEMPEPPVTKDLIFLSTHEPCTMCMSAITWAGFDNFYYFFSHEDSRDAFAIPHDLKILKEVFGLEPGGYRRNNAFWHSAWITDMVETADEPMKSTLKAQITRIKAMYDDASGVYQSKKGESHIPLA
jgi:tRNA(Arg) A34 adenosine deaminase TadA